MVSDTESDFFGKLYIDQWYLLNGSLIKTISILWIPSVTTTVPHFWGHL